MTRRTPSYVARTALFITLFAVSVVSVFASPVLLWDANPDPSVAGYRVYAGTLSHTYTSVVDVGLQTSNTLDNLSAGLTYYFAVTAYTADGLESPFSDEVSFTPRVDGISSATVETLFSAANNERAISFSAQAGQECRVVASSDLETWQEVYFVTMLTNGTVRYVDGTLETAPMRFYRTVVTPVLPSLPDADGILGNVLAK